LEVARVGVEVLDERYVLGGLEEGVGRQSPRPDDLRRFHCVQPLGKRDLVAHHFAPGEHVDDLVERQRAFERVLARLQGPADAAHEDEQAEDEGMAYEAHLGELAPDRLGARALRHDERLGGLVHRAHRGLRLHDPVEPHAQRERDEEQASADEPEDDGETLAQPGPSPAPEDASRRWSRKPWRISTAATLSTDSFRSRRRTPPSIRVRVASAEVKRSSHSWTGRRRELRRSAAKACTFSAWGPSVPSSRRGRPTTTSSTPCARTSAATALTSLRGPTRVSVGRPPA